MLNWFSLADLSLVYLFIPINLRRNKIEIYLKYPKNISSFIPLSFIKRRKVNMYSRHQTFV